MTIFPKDPKLSKDEIAPAWLQSILDNCQNTKKKQFLKQSFILARLTGNDCKTSTGESCFEEGLAIAYVLSLLHVDEETLAAGLLYSVAQYTDLKAEDISEYISNKVSKLIRGTKQLDNISDLHQAIYSKEQQKHNLDNIRKLLLAMVEDIRVVLIKIAERLHVLRSAQPMDNVSKQRIATEVMSIYAPLANRLGITPIKLEMEDLAFKYLEPEPYQKLSTYLQQSREDREQYIKEVILEVNELLTSAGIKDFQVTGRAKHIYSIYRKMQRKQVDIDEIYDVSAIRILVNNIEDCYAVLGLVHGKWQQIFKEFDDYIASPKPNGYRSIHTAIVGPKSINLEIQIRTYEMHQMAELGVAAHWVYKEGAPQKANYEAKISWLRQVMDWQQEITADEKELDSIRQIFNDRVYVFTPAGDILNLPQGATPLDFAYYVHSALGHACRGAKINGNIVPLTYQLKTGEHVEIIKGKHAAPKRDWLNPELGFLKTSRAKAKILHWLKMQDYEENREHGQEILNAEIRRLNCPQIDVETLHEKLQFNSYNDMLAALGAGDIKVGSISSLLQNIIKKNQNKNLELAAQKSFQKPISKERSNASDIQIQGIDNLLTTIAQCCKPIPGEHILGYVTIGRGVSIHRANCHNILYAKQNKPEKILTVTWGNNAEHKYPVSVVVTASARPALVRDITNVIAKENLMLTSLNLATDKDDNCVSVYLTISIPNILALQRILAKIAKIQNVLTVEKNNE